LEIAKRNPERPLSAISEVAWHSTPGSNLEKYAVEEKGKFRHALRAIAPNVKERVDDAVLSILSFGNANVIKTEEGLVMIDCGSMASAETIRSIVKDEFPDERLHTVIYTHGHIDHCMLSFSSFESETSATVVAHKNIIQRFNRYKKTAGYNTHINKVQFRLPEFFNWPVEYRYPDVVFEDNLSLTIGSQVFELFHFKGETDDATIVWMPNKKYVFMGDFFIWRYVFG